MIKVRKSGAWVDVTTYKRRTAGVWEWVDLGKRWFQPPTTHVAHSRLIFDSATPSEWETIGTAGASSSIGTLTNTGDYVIPTVAGSYAQGQPATFSSTKYYMEADIEFLDGGTGGLPAFMSIQGTALPVQFILVPSGGSLYHLVLKDTESEENVPSSPSTIALNTRYIVTVEWDTTTKNVAFYIDNVSIADVTMAALSVGNINYMSTGDLDENFGSNKFKLYRVECGTHTNTLPGGGV